MTVDLTKMAVWWRLHRQHPTETRAPNPHEVVIGRKEDRSPVTWPAPSREHASHALVMGSSGSGKTAMIAGALVEEIARDNSDNSYLIVDPLKGDLIGHVIEGMSARCPQRLERDCFFLDPFSEGGFPFNLNHLPLADTPLDIRALQIANLVSTVSTALGDVKHLGTGSRQMDVLLYTCLGALSAVHPLASILWAHDALVFPRGMEMLASICTSERAKRFLLTAQISDELRASCSSRLRIAFSAADSLERIVTVPGACLRFKDVLGPKKICLVDLGRPFGGLTVLAEFWANLLVRLALDFLLARPSPWQGSHTKVVIDEAQVLAQVLADRAESTLTMGRSKSISLTTATQGTVLVQAASPTLLRVLLGNTPLKYVARLSSQDAELYARERAPRLGSDENLSTVRQKFTAAVTNLEDRQFFRIRPGEFTRFRSADVDLDGWKQAAQEKKNLIDGMKRRLALPPSSGPRITLADVVKLPERKRGRRKAQAAQADASTPPKPSPPTKPRSRWG